MSEQKTKIAIWSSSAYSEWDISDALCQINVSHTLEPRDRTKPTRHINMGRWQPKQVRVTTSLKTIDPQAVNFIVASYGALSVTNIPALPFSATTELVDALKIALQSDQVTAIKVDTLTPVDFINMVAKPSHLNKVQTEILRIQPYSLRKEAQAMVLQYFNSRASKRQLNQFLAKSLKLERLKSALEPCDLLREAVAMLSSMDAESIQAKTGIPSFDLLYLFNAGKPKVPKVKK